jgi:hypothetical protein
MTPRPRPSCPRPSERCVSDCSTISRIPCEPTTCWRCRQTRPSCPRPRPNGARLEEWIDEQVRALPAKRSAKQREAAGLRYRREVVEQAAYTWLNRLVYLRLLEGMKLRTAKLLTGGFESSVYADFRDLAKG